MLSHGDCDQLRFHLCGQATKANEDNAGGRASHAKDEFTKVFVRGDEYRRALIRFRQHGVIC